VTGVTVRHGGSNYSALPINAAGDSARPDLEMMTMTRLKFTGPVSTAFAACALLAAGISAAAAGPETVKTFRHVTVTPVHVSAQPSAIADKFCVGEGYYTAGAELFIGLDIKDGTASALFRQITCVPDMRRRFLPHADDLSIPVGQ
jgi:hypothetical protein